MVRFRSKAIHSVVDCNTVCYTKNSSVIFIIISFREIRSKMKYYVAILLIAAVVLAEQPEWKVQTQENLIAYRPVCASSLNIPEATVNEYKKWNFPDDEKTRCYIRCIFEKMGLFTDANGFHVERLVKQLGQGRNETQIKPEVEKCADKNPNKDHACIWAFRGFNCFKAAHLNLVQTSVKKN